MTDPGPRPSTPLAWFQGRAYLTASQVMLKGLLESEVAASTLVGPAVAPFDGVFAAAAESAAADVLAAHDLRLLITPSAVRAVTLAARRAVRERPAVVFVPVDHLAAAVLSIGPDGAGPMVLVLEDRPAARGVADPVSVVRRLGIPAMMPADVSALPGVLDAALGLARAGGEPAAVIIHHAVLEAAATVDVKPNRVAESVDAMLARRRERRRAPGVDVAGPLRAIRRRELNRAYCLPSPGERTSLGFVTVGPADAALRAVEQRFELEGRLARLHLGAIEPVDEAAVRRLLERCERVVVLEPNPGLVESAIREVAETMRTEDGAPGTVWGRRLPALDEAGPAGLGPDDSLHPSIIARRLLPLLRQVRPGAISRTPLVPAPEQSGPDVPDRGALLGAAAALAEVRTAIVEIDGWLRTGVTGEDRDEHDPEVPDDGEDRPALPSGIRLNGDPLADPVPERIIPVELWPPDRFLREGLAAVRQAARERGPWLLVVADLGTPDGIDIERFAQGVIPGESADRTRLVRVSLDDGVRLRDVLREAVLVDDTTILVVRDGTPPRFDVAAIEREHAEVDALGFDPLQSMEWPADVACTIGRSLAEVVAATGREGEPTRATFDLHAERAARRRPWIRLRLRPLREQVEVKRTRPPVRGRGGERLPLPEIAHREAGHWRAHLAGIRGTAPGVVGRVLAAAGRAMGYDVRTQTDGAPIGAGRGAWTQVLFTRPRAGDAPAPLATRIPFGEADLVLGLDVLETRRALESDPVLRVLGVGRSHAVVNVGYFRDERRTDVARAHRARLADLVGTAGAASLVEDFTAVCRTWFHTDRVADLVMLGAAFQSGLVPLTVDALDAALLEAEAGGAGRAREACRFGRELVIDPRRRGRPTAEQDEPVRRIVGRALRRDERRARSRIPFRPAPRLGRLLADGLAAMPGLVETDTGRRAQRSFVRAVEGAERWEGPDGAERFVRIVTDLYRVDRGETGRALTRNAIRPLAQVWLIRDPHYVAAMVTRREHLHDTRRLLDVKPTRGDELVRRYMTRIELLLAGRRYRADVVTGIGMARMLAATRHVVPNRWRGSRRQRELRDYVIDLAERAARAGEREYERYAEALRLLSVAAEEGTLRGWTAAEAREFAEG